MAYLFHRHNWGWPRRRGDQHIQVCLTCGSEREALVQFEGPRYHRTQDGSPDGAINRRARREPFVLPNVA